jgi:predicted ATPase
MWVSQLTIKNIRGFNNSTIQFSQGINVIIGPNNAGKTTILKSIYLIQDANALLPQDQRLYSSEGNIQLSLSGNTNLYFPKWPNTSNFEIKLPNRQRILHAGGGRSTGFNEIPRQEPSNFIYPYLSKRKVAAFQEQINLNLALSVTGNFANLYPKIDRISNPQFQPAYDEYVQACDEILGFRITCTASPDGKKGAYIVKNLDHITLDAMGEGVANLLGLIVDLCIAENKLFLIEEPENDIHPKALKKLLGLISKKSAQNQFIITTHSNIVTKYLGAQDSSKIINVKMTFRDKLPTSSVEYIDTPEKRRTALEDLGYDLFDFDLWDSWLILEESSAERLVRDVLIPVFTPDLKSKLRTFSAHSISEVESRFIDFNNLFVFLHLQPHYKNKAWVVVDGGKQEERIIEKMRSVYSQSGWNKDQFLQFSEHDFEKYYPEPFQDQVKEILSLTVKSEKRERKKQLLKKVLTWCKEDNSRAKGALEESASEVIELLKNIEKNLNGT